MNSLLTATLIVLVLVYFFFPKLRTALTQPTKHEASVEDRQTKIRMPWSRVQGRWLLVTGMSIILTGVCAGLLLETFPLLPTVIVSSIVALPWLVVGALSAVVIAVRESDVAYVRVGPRGAEVFTSGTFLCLPMIHHVTRVNLKPQAIEVQGTAVANDLTVHSFAATGYIAVQPDSARVRAAVRLLGSSAEGQTLWRSILERRVQAAFQNAIAKRSADQIMLSRGSLGTEVARQLQEQIAGSGFEIESIKISSITQEGHELPRAIPS